MVTGERATIEDLESKNGTFRGSEEISRPVPLADGDRLKLGSMWLTYRFLPLAEETKTAHTRGP